MNNFTRIRLGHGSGGALSRSLVEDVFLPVFSNPALVELDDSAVLCAGTARLAFTTDGYVVSPIEFPGGDIGRIAVCGTVNDLSVKGAVPRWLSASFILEEGLELDVLRRIIASMKAAADEAGVVIATGDTKVVERGKADRIFISTAGVGVIEGGLDLASSKVRPGDSVLVSGSLGRHGVAVMNARHRLGIRGDITSDAAPLNGIARLLVETCPSLHAMRDLTRGGLATALNEIALASGVRIEIDESLLPVEQPVRAACSILGLDPLYIANEGRLAAFMPAEQSGGAVAAMRSARYGEGACVIGSAREGKPGVFLKTRSGGIRTLRIMEGEQLPRIC